MKNNAQIVIAAIALISSMLMHGYPAVVTAPVADLLFEPMSELKDHYKKGFSYEQLPISGEPLACPRAHQLRANDLVNVLEERDDEVKIYVPSFFYLRKDSPVPQHHYWMRKKDILSCEKIAHTAAQPCIPKPIMVGQPIPKAIMLTQPWYDHKTKTLFSAGTRFLAESSDDNHYYLYVFNPSEQGYVTTACPLNHCITTPTTPLKERRLAMIDLLRSWAPHTHGFIPYAWGGCSIVQRINAPHAHEHTIERTNGTTPRYYQWPGKQHTPKTGIDCSGLILLAAQTAGIPYHCKNSYTAATTLRPITRSDELEVGDVIVIRGHTMLVADLERNTLIEARGYGDGYGKVHEISLSEEFKNINTYEDLFRSYEQQSSVERLDKNGNSYDTVQIKLFKLAVE